jgi:predicted anti-sigma-YlaC factor YlaD
MDGTDRNGTNERMRARLKRRSSGELNTRWNHAPEMTDYCYVDCEEYREALSARLDDEQAPEDARLPADRHLEDCADCALWYDNAAFITRRTRTTAAVSWPDVADAVLARMPASTMTTAGRLRVALGVVGAAQGTSALLSLTGTSSPAGGAFETGAWQLALAVAFCAVAVRRAPPAGLVPLLATFVGVLSWGHLAGDLTTTLPYLLSVAGLVLVLLLGRMPPLRRGPIRPSIGSAQQNHSPEDRAHLGISLTKPTKAA